MKEQRLQAIHEILTSQQVGSQDELQQLLSAKGFSVTQATLSRDIRALRVAKRPTRDGGYVYVPENPAQVVPGSGKGLVESLEFSGQLAVLKTRPGYAAAVASEIDKHSPREICGTIAGDDTILIIPREGVSREEIKAVLKPMM